MKTPFILSIVICLSLFFIPDSFGGIYKCTDNSGQTTFATKPGPGCRLLPGSAAPYRNRLATSADWFVSITKSHNPVLQKELKRLSMDEYLAALKTAATQLEQCVSGLSQNQSRLNVKAARMAAECYMSLYGIK